MRNSVLKRMLAMAMSFVMTVSAIPLKVSAEGEEAELVYGAADKTITGLGTGAIGDPAEPKDTITDDKYYGEYWSGSFVYYGKYDFEKNGENQTIQVKYRVLDKDTVKYSANEGNGRHTMLLDCNNTLYTERYAPEGWTADKAEYYDFWKESEIKSSLNTDAFYNRKLSNGDYGLTSAEKQAIAPSYVETWAYEPDADDCFWWIDGTYRYYTGLYGEKVFLLDAYDAHDPEYGYLKRDVRNNSRIKISVAHPDPENVDVENDPYHALSYWWLRSVRHDPSVYKEMGAISNYGNRFDFVVGYDYNKYGISPAFNVALDSVIFTSEAGESDFGKEYKLTLSDNAIHASVDSRGVVIEGNKVTIPYTVSGGNAKNVNRLSVLLTDKPYVPGECRTSGYTYLKVTAMNAYSGNGSGFFYLPSEYAGKKWGSDFYAYIVAEDVNDEYESDYASLPTEFKYLERYTVSFDACGHGTAPDAQTVIEGDKAVEPDDLSEEGYIFEGWYEDEEYTSEYDFDEAVSESMTLYAKWERVKCSVTFDLNGFGSSETVEVYYGDLIEEPETPEAEGYKFAGWYKESALTSIYDFLTPVKENITLYARWIEKTKDIWTVTFDLNGMPGTAPAAVEVIDGETAECPAAPAAEGYIFIGWYTDSALTTAYDFTAPVNSSFTLYAKWEKEKRVVTFDLNGHGGLTTVEVSYGDPVAEPEVPEAAGYVFAGWYLESICLSRYDFSNGVTADLTLYAKWKESSLTPAPEITIDTTELFLVKGQSFTLEGEGWSSSGKEVTVSKKGVVKAKKATSTSVNLVNKNSNRVIYVTVYQPKIKNKYDLQAGNTQVIEISGYDKDRLSVEFASSAPDVASVSPDGTVTALTKGSATITAYINGMPYKCKITVKESVPAIERTIHVTAGSSKVISVKGVKKWICDDVQNVTVKNKKVKPLKTGEYTLTGTTKDNRTYIVHLISEDPEITTKGIVKTKENKYTLDMKKGESLKLEYKYLDQKVVFKSSKPDTVYVDLQGNIIAGKAGKKVKLTAKINGKTVTITVNVTE